MSLIQIDPDVVAAAPLTGRQFDIIEFIRAHVELHGYPPTVREIGDDVGLSSTSSVHHQLRRLEELGVLVRGERRSRAMSLTAAA